jgi:hypothetical protein
MSVLPKSASFASFFVVFAILFLFTILLGLNLPTLLANLFHLTQGWSPQARLSLKRPSFSLSRPEWTKIDYIQGYVDILNPTIDLRDSLSRPRENWGYVVGESWPFLFFWYVFRRFPVLVLHHFLANEVNFPFYQWFLYQHRHNPRMNIKYHWVFFVKDFFRFFLIPVWFVLGGAVICYLVVQDVLGLFFIPILRPVLRPVLRLILPVFTICFIGRSAVVHFFRYKILRRHR